jgi:hypothetical protein
MGYFTTSRETAIRVAGTYDCGSAFISTTVARIGAQTLTVCPPSHYTLIAQAIGS